MNEKYIIIAVVVLVVLVVVIYLVRKNAEKKTFVTSTATTSRKGKGPVTTGTSRHPSAASMKQICKKAYSTPKQQKLCQDAVTACYPMVTAANANDFSGVLNKYPACSKAVTDLNPQDTARAIKKMSQGQACVPAQMTQMIPQAETAVAGTQSLLNWVGQVSGNMPGCKPQASAAGTPSAPKSGMTKTTVGTSGPTSTRHHQDTAGSYSGGGHASGFSN